VLNSYDDRDRTIAQKLADSSTFRIAYTTGGGKITRADVADRRGSIRRVDLDAQGRVVRNAYPAGHPLEQVQTFSYDAKGRE
jgi:hypothetical protein